MDIIRGDKANLKFIQSKLEEYPFREDTIWNPVDKRYRPGEVDTRLGINLVCAPVGAIKIWLFKTDEDRQKFIDYSAGLNK